MKKYVILIPFHNPWKWHTDYANQTATILSRTHIVVCFLWGDTVSLWELLRRHKTYRPIVRQKNLWKVQPLYLLPGKRIFAIQLVNIFLNVLFVHILCSGIALWHARTKLFWFFGYYDPAFIVLPPFFRHWKTVYDCVDIATHPNQKLARQIRASETLLLRYAWIVVANSQTLHSRIRIKRPDVYMVPLGFRIDMFRRPKHYPSGYTGRRPVVGYIGSIDYRLDFAVLLSVIKARPDWQFMLFGPVFYDHLTAAKRRAMEIIFALPNVTYDNVDPAMIPSVLSRFCVALIPYDMTIPLSKYAYPMKIMEYFYARKPVVSAPINELLRFVPLVRFARSRAEWCLNIHSALTHPMTAAQKRLAVSIAHRNSWEHKIAEIMTFLAAQSRRNS
jgi:hypothetical protein